MRAEVELHLPPDVAYVGLARLAVTVAARKAGMHDERVEDLRIAVSEATTNAILAHQVSCPDKPVVLSFGPHEAEGFEVLIEDAGPGFVPITTSQFAGKELTREGGLGVTLIRGLADEVEFIRGEGMTIHMRFAVGLLAEEAC